MYSSLGRALPLLFAHSQGLIVTQRRHSSGFVPFRPQQPYDQPQASSLSQKEPKSESSSPLILPETTGDIAMAVCDAFCRIENPAQLGGPSNSIVRPLTMQQITELIHHSLASKDTDGESTFCGRDLRNLLVGNTIQSIRIAVEKLERVDFSSTRLLTITAQCVSFARSLFVNSFFDECFFDQCAFDGCVMKNAFMRNCRFVRCSFSFASLENANVAENCSFVECELDLADMTRLITSNPSEKRIFDVSEGAASTPVVLNTAEERLQAGTRFVRCHNWTLARRAMWRHPTPIQKDGDVAAVRQQQQREKLPPADEEPRAPKRVAAAKQQ